MDTSPSRVAVGRWSVVEYCGIASYVIAHLWMYFDPFSWNVLGRIKWIIEVKSLYWTSPLPPHERHFIGGWQELLLATLVGGVAIGVTWHLARTSLWKTPIFWLTTLASGCLLIGMAATLREASWQGVRRSIPGHQLYFATIGKILLDNGDDQHNDLLKVYGLKKLRAPGKDRFHLWTINPRELAETPKIYALGLVEYDHGRKSVIFETCLVGVNIVYTPSTENVWFVPKRSGKEYAELISWNRIIIAGPEVAALAIQ